MPLVRSFWIREKGNFVAVTFKKVEPSKVEETFASPSGDGIDSDLVAYFKTMQVGDAIEIALKDSGVTAKSERSFKVKIGKHASLANRKIDNRAVPGGFIFRVIEVNQPKAESNGTTTSEVTVTDTPLQNAPAEEAASRGRNR